MTRRELREHCFKMLFSANFYDTEEAEEQLDRYFDAPEEDEMDPDGKTEVVHQVGLREEDKEYLHNRVEHIMREHSGAGRQTEPGGGRLEDQAYGKGGADDSPPGAL